MKMETRARDAEVMRYTSEIVASYLQGNQVPIDEVPSIMDVVHRKVASLCDVAASGRMPAPAVPVEKSITPDHIICLEDGKSFKMLKKHLKTKYNMTPEDYRAKWGLPADYPMVAPNYAAKRQQLARESGLGKNR